MPADRSSWSRWRLCAAKAATLAGSLLLVFGLLELLLSLRYDEEPYFRLTEPYGSPYVFSIEPGLQETNDLGIRRRSQTSERKPENVFRILSYGDSIAAGYSVATVHMYAHFLERRLEQAGDGAWEVLSMSRGNSPTIHTFHLRQDVPRLEPDAVLLEIELSNDVSDEARVVTRGEDPSGLPLEVLSYRYLLTYDRHPIAPITFRGSWLERTKTYYGLSRLIGRLGARVRVNPAFAPESDTFYYSLDSDRFLLTEEALEHGFDSVFASIAGIHRYLKRRDVAFLLAIVPSRYAFEESSFRDGARRLVKRAEERAAALDIPYVSLLRDLEAAGGAGLYMDFCHPTPEGNEAIAGALFEPVRALRVSAESERLSDAAGVTEWN